MHNTKYPEISFDSKTTEASPTTNGAQKGKVKVWNSEHQVVFSEHVYENNLVAEMSDKFIAGKLNSLVVLSF